MREKTLNPARSVTGIIEKPRAHSLLHRLRRKLAGFELGVWTEEMTFTPRRLRSDLYFSMEQKLRENKIEIPFPQRDIHLRSGTLLRGRDENESRGS